MIEEIAKAKKLLQEICEKHKENDKDIMQGIKGEKLHAFDVLEWIEKLNPNASMPLKLAALFHDVDRIITPGAGGGFKGDRNSETYENHKKMHAKRSAEFIIPLLKEIVKDEKMIEEVNFLINHHDDTGAEVEEIKNTELNYMVAADSFAFFTTVAPKLYAAEGKERIKDKVKFMIEKMPEFARKMLSEHTLDNQIFNDLKNGVIEEYYRNQKRESKINFR